MAGKKKKPKALVPPPGLYDPALDASLGAGQRGLGDLQADYGRDFGAGYGGGRTGHDYLLGLGQLDLGHTRAGEDFTTQRQGVERGYGRGKQDYERNVGDLNLSYRRLAGHQAQGARLGGVMSGGLAAKAKQIRAGNQAHDRAPLDTGFARLGEDRGLALTGIGTAQGRETADWGTNRGTLGLNYQRAQEDAQQGLTRAGREQGQFGLDTNAARVFSATQLGWNPADPEADDAAQRAGARAGETAATAAARRRYRRGRRGSLRGTVGQTRVVAPSYG